MFVVPVMEHFFGKGEKGMGVGVSGGWLLFEECLLKMCFGNFMPCVDQHPRNM